MHWHDPSRIPERGVPVFCLSSLLGNVHHQGGQEQIRVEKGVGPKIIIAVIITDSSVPKKAKGSYGVFIYIYIFFPRRSWERSWEGSGQNLCSCFGPSLY